MTFKLFFAAALAWAAALANAQPRVLMEACNAIDDRAKRMECLDQLMQLQPANVGSARNGDSQELALKRAKAAFASIASVVQTGISYNNYSALILEPAKELGVLRQGAPVLNTQVFEKLSESVRAYNDAAIVWQASIYQTQNAGVFGRILAPDRSGLMPIVNRYGLSTTTVLLNQHLPAEEALAKIWRHAALSSERAFDIADGVHTGATEATCDQWGNPKDIEGNPCVQN